MKNPTRLGLGRTLLLGSILSILAPMAPAQTTLGIDANGRVFEVDFQALSATFQWATGLPLVYGIASTANPDVYYLTDNQGDHYEMDMVAQTTTLLGSTPLGLQGLTLNEDNGTYYTNTTSSLYDVDPQTGVANLVGPFVSGNFLSALEYHRGVGKLFTVNLFNGDLTEVDLTTGMATGIGYTGSNRIVGLWYDEASGRTFGVTDINQQGRLYEVDVQTGAGTLLTTTGINFTALGGEVPGSSVGTAFCFGDGSGTACPCANESTAGRGCSNSAGTGGLLFAGGSNSVGADDVEFSAASLPASKPALLFVGDASLGLGNPFGDGLLCVGGNIQRLDVLFTDGAGAATWPTGQSSMGGWGAGDQRWFQVWFRDPAGPCSSQFNTTNGLDVSFDV